MTTASRKIFLILFFVFLLNGVLAALPSVVIQPKNNVDVVDIYPFETAEYDLIVSNHSSEEMHNINFLVSVDKELVLVDNGTEAREKKLVVQSLMPKDEAVLKLKVKALEYGTKNFLVKVAYGFDVFSHETSTYLRVSKSPVELNSRLEKTALNPEEEGSVLVDITNTSTETLSNISTNLIVPAGIRSLAQEFSLDSLDPGQGFSNTEFRFVPEQNVDGKKHLIIQISYVDGKGNHVIEKSLEINVQNRNIYLLIIGVAIILLVIASYLLGKRPKKELEKPSIISQEKPKPEEIKK